MLTLSTTAIVAYLALFGLLGFGFLFANLVVGRLLRPNSPNKEKLEVYECGEPTIGSSFVQFDLRFYVVALLFIIFDVEIAFFFPWAVVFGKSTELMNPNLPVVVQSAGDGLAASDNQPRLTPQAADLYRELGVRDPAVEAAPLTPALSQREREKAIGAAASESVEAADLAVRHSARQLARLSIADIGVFFAVLLVGFAYVWKRGDLDWVRAVSRERSAVDRSPPYVPDEAPALSASGS